MGRICDFPLSYTTSLGKDKIIYVDSSDYVKYVSGEKTLEEAFGHYLDSQVLEELKCFEKTHDKTEL